MLYRNFGKTGEKLSILGFGAMRLPVIDNDDTKIDEKQALEIIRYSIDHGVNYLDTAYPYHGGNSEIFCAKVLKDGYRAKTNIATKLPSWEVKTHADMERLLDEQRAKLGVDVIDFYLLHALSTAHWPPVRDNDYKTFLDKAKRDGKIRYAGFSFHDHLPLFKEIIDDYDWDFCQIQLNYLDENYQGGLEGMQYAASKGMGVIVMEPLRGGMLSNPDQPPEVEKLWNSAEQKRTPAEWALRYLWNHPEVGVVLSGMSTMMQVVENVNIASGAHPQSLTQHERDIIKQVKAFYAEKMAVNCTTCRYCMPCPVGVNIPELFWAYNHAALFDDVGKAKYWVNNWLKEHERPSNCIECGECEDKCPQNLEIRKHLKTIAENYEN